MFFLLKNELNEFKSLRHVLNYLFRHLYRNKQIESLKSSIKIKYVCGMVVARVVVRLYAI